MKAKHTPGPWNLHPYYDGEPMIVEPESGGPPWTHWSRKIAVGEKIICDVIADSDGGQGFPRVDNREENEANARLIAAAPDLLEALEAIKTIATPPHHENAFPAIVGIAQAAIAKAKGGANE